jgi:hypothetical protein
MSVKECRIINLPSNEDPRGKLTVVEGKRNIPFEIKRIYYLYDVPKGKKRAGHAHKHLEEFMIAASGSFDVALEDGVDQARFHLDQPNSGLYIAPSVWLSLENFAPNSISLVLASDFYDERDYIRNYAQYKEWIAKNAEP